MKPSAKAALRKSAAVFLAAWLGFSSLPLAAAMLAGEPVRVNPGLRRPARPARISPPRGVSASVRRLAPVPPAARPSKAPPGLQKLAAAPSGASAGRRDPREPSGLFDGALAFDPAARELVYLPTGEKAAYLGRGDWKRTYVLPGRPDRVVKVFAARGVPAFLRGYLMRLESANVERLASVGAGPRLFETGVTAEGFPYQITERVQGPLLSALAPRQGAYAARLARGLLRRLGRSGFIVQDLDGSNVMAGVTASNPVPRAYVIDAPIMHTRAWAARLLDRLASLLRRLSLVPKASRGSSRFVIGIEEQIEYAEKLAPKTSWLSAAAAFLSGQKRKFDRNAPLSAPSFAAVGVAALSAATAAAGGWRPSSGAAVAALAAPLFLSSRFRSAYRLYIKEEIAKRLCGFADKGGSFDRGKTAPRLALRFAGLSVGSVPLYLAGARFSGPEPFALIGLGLFGLPAGAYLLGRSVPRRLGAATAAMGALGLSILAYDASALGFAVLGAGAAVRLAKWAAWRFFAMGETPAPWTARDALYWAAAGLAGAGAFGSFKRADFLYQLGLFLGLGDEVFSMAGPRLAATLRFLRARAMRSSRKK